MAPGALSPWDLWSSGSRARARRRVAVAAAVPGSALPAAATKRLGVVASHRPPRRSSRKYVRCLPRGRRVWRVPLRPPLLDTSAARIPTTPRTPQRLPRVRATDRRGQAVDALVSRDLRYVRRRSVWHGSQQDRMNLSFLVFAPSTLLRSGATWSKLSKIT